MTFADYTRHGWKLTPIAPGSKGPRHEGWNRIENCVTTPERAASLQSAGLCHAYSGTCAVDIDDLEYVRAQLLLSGISLDDLLAAPDAVRIERGDPNRTKLLYALDEPLATLKPIRGLELRCASRNGPTVQDVLPPSMHPSGEPYRWVYGDELVGDWRVLPPLPAALRTFWESRLVAPAEGLDVPEATTDELTELLAGFDPDAGYDEWLRIGMAVHHATGGSDTGLQLWDRWSSQGDKYDGYGDLKTHWRSFQANGEGVVTVNSLRGQAVAAADDFDAIEPEDDPWAEETEKREADAASRFALVPIAEWAARPPVPWLIEGLLPQADLAMVYGQSGSGKTFWALDLALTIALGRQWRESQTVAGPVAWIAAEAAGSLRDRALAYATQYGARLEDAALYVTGETPNLSNLAEVKALTLATAAVSPVLVIIDTLAAASGGANENSGEDMNLVLAACRAMHAATGALVLLVHHSGKDLSRGARGWSGIKAAMDTEIEVVEFGDDTRAARITKQRDGESGTAFGFRLQSNGESCYVEHGNFYEAPGDGVAAIVKGEVQQILYDTATRLAPVGENTVDAGELRDAAVAQMTHTGEGRDQRRSRVVRAMNRMVAEGLFEKHGDVITLPGIGFETEE